MEGNLIRNIDTTTTTIDNDDNDDRISELPDFIAHRILSFLDEYPAELIRTSVLSKRWSVLTASSPNLVFHCGLFCKPEYPRDIFLKYIIYTTSRISQQQNFVTPKEFYLYADLEDPAYADIINRCLGLILKQGLQEFKIFNRSIRLSIDQQPPPMYRLPDKLSSVSSLTSLTIICCELPSSLMVDAVKFKSLKVLHLHGVYLNEEMIKRLIAGCPLLEKFNVYCCYGFKRLCVCGHQYLQNVGVRYTSAVEEIDIQAPNLAYIDLLNARTRAKPPCVNLFSGQNLSIIFKGYLSKLFAVSLSNFPFLETLVLNFSKNYKNFELSSHSLRKLRLETHTDLDEIKIDTPNLLYFQYYASESYVHGPMGDSGESKACMDCFPDFDVDTSWFQKFRRFLGRTVPFKVLKLEIFPKFTDVGQLKLLESSRVELDHIELNVRKVSELSEYLPVVDAVLWCCRPRSLTLKSDYFNDLERRDQIVKFTYEKLLEQEDQSQTKIQIAFSTVKVFRSNQFLIIFLKEEVNQEAG